MKKISGEKGRVMNVNVKEGLPFKTVPPNVCCHPLAVYCYSRVGGSLRGN